MKKLVRLRGTVRLEQNRSFTFTSSMHDGTPFHLTARPHDVQLAEEFLPSRMTVEGYLFVTSEAQQDTRHYLTLPVATDRYGKQVVVHDNTILPLKQTLEQFRPQRVGVQVDAAGILPKQSEKDSGSEA